jgi:hypothetical protein
VFMSDNGGTVCESLVYSITMSKLCSAFVDIERPVAI